MCIIVVLNMIFIAEIFSSRHGTMYDFKQQKRQIKWTNDEHKIQIQYS